HLRAQHRFVKRDGEIEAQIRSFGPEIGMGGDPDRNEHVPGRPTRTGQALPLQADLLTVGEPGGNFDFAPLSRRGPAALAAALGCAFGGLRQSNRHRGADIVAGRRRAEISRLKPFRAAAGSGGSCSATPEAAHHLAENVLEAAEAAAGAAARATKAFGAPGET